MLSKLLPSSRLPVALSVLALLGLMNYACTHDTPSAPAESLATETASEPASAPEGCDDSSFCTREYMPTSCLYEGQNFEASNRCEALKLARRFACEQNQQFDEQAAACVQVEATGDEEGM